MKWFLLSAFYLLNQANTSPVTELKPPCEYFVACKMMLIRSIEYRSLLFLLMFTIYVICSSCQPADGVSVSSDTKQSAHAAIGQCPD